MRLAIITPKVDRNDGQGRVNMEIAVEAIRQGHEVTLFAEQVQGLPTLGAEGLRTVLLTPPPWLPSRLLRDQLFALRSYLALRREANWLDALLANGFVTWAKCDINAVHFVHASWLSSPSHPGGIRDGLKGLYASVYSRINVMLEAGAFRRSRYLVPVSESVAGDLRRVCQSQQGTITITNGVDITEFFPGPAERRRFGMLEGVPLALFAGDLRSPRKNLDTVLRSLTRVPELHLAVAGRAEGTPYPELACRIGVADRVHFLGFRRDMPDLMRSADLFVFPSRYEACSLVLLEALASGLPVVTARSTGGSELVTPEVGVVIANSESIDELACALQSLVADAVRRQAMAHRARALAERHSWKAMATRYLDLLTLVAAERAHASHRRTNRMRRDGTPLSSVPRV